VYLTQDPIDLGRLLAQVQSPARGGISSFLGTVRDHQDGRRVLRLEYSAYEPMAEAECDRIVKEAEARWDCCLALQHRIGVLAVGEIAVAIVAASPHRAEAFSACRYAIEEVKRRVPIWKREAFSDGSVDWVGSREAGRQGSGDVDDATTPRTSGVRS
jgi:molybdopterin synthase catalytic subunit